MKVQYQAKIIRDRGSYVVEFPDLPGCLTEGDTVEDALANAREALTGWLAASFDRGFQVPRPRSHRGNHLYPVAPAPYVVIPMALRWLREDQGLDQAAVAKRLKVSPQAYQRLEHPGKCNPTLKHLQSVIRALGHDLDVGVQ